MTWRHWWRWLLPVFSHDMLHTDANAIHIGLSPCAGGSLTTWCDSCILCILRLLLFCLLRHDWWGYSCSNTGHSWPFPLLSGCFPAGWGSSNWILSTMATLTCPLPFSHMLIQCPQFAPQLLNQSIPRLSKKPYQCSNHCNALGQMLITNQHLDKIVATCSDFEARGMLEGNVFTDPHGGAWSLSKFFQYLLMHKLNMVTRYSWLCDGCRDRQGGCQWGPPEWQQRMWPWPQWRWRGQR